MSSEAAYRFSRGVHPAMAERGVRRGLAWMRLWSGGTVEQGLVDSYPLPPEDPTVTVTPGDVRRWLGLQLSTQVMAELLERLEFAVEVDGESVRAKTPDHRLDIGSGVIGVADLMEEIARIYGYDRIPETRLADELPPQRGNPALEKEERMRDLLADLGLQEVVTYRMTSREREARRLPPGTQPNDRPYVGVVNPIASDRDVLRQSLLSSVLEIAERNARTRERMALFEIGPVFAVSEEGELPEELPMLALVLCGPRHLPTWQGTNPAKMDFYDLKGVVEGLLDGLHVAGVRYEPAEHPSFHPGKCARLSHGERYLGTLGELHPLVRERYELPAGAPLLAAELDLPALQAATPLRHEVQGVPTYPPVLEDLAVIVDQGVPAEQVEAVIRAAGGKTLTGLRLFDVFSGEQVGAGKKSLAYSLTFQADRTLTDEEVRQIRQRIVRRLEQDLGAKLRS
jgi:phenylalanyl-tRNA synthetase beta chain